MRPAWLAGFLGLAGLLVFLGQALLYAHSSTTSLDEGAYLYKGYLFVRGDYHPFEPYGPLTNKAPLAFLLPGIVQYVFGPGLREGRYFSILLGVMAILGTAWTARRLAGKWWAVLCIWAFALSPAIVKLYSIAVSEVLIACMLAWLLALVLDPQARPWQCILACGLASLVVLTRQNMIFFLPFLYGYVFWRFGWKTSWQSLASGAAVFLAGHALYWPRILTMWTPWLPRELTPFLDAFRGPLHIITAWNPELDWASRLSSFFQGVRQHFIVLVGSGICALLWLFFAKKGQPRLREAVFLGSLYFALAALHAWAAIGSDYDTYSCVYCFSPYLGFFDPVGVLFLAVSLSSLRELRVQGRFSALQSMAASLLVLVTCAGIGLSLFADLDKRLLSFPFPRFQGGRILPGATTFWDALLNKFDLPVALLRKYSTAGMGFVAGLLILLIAWLLWRRYRDHVGSYARSLLPGFLVLGFLFTPWIAGSESRPDCATDVIRQNEVVGGFLAANIPAGSLVYWDGGLSVVPLLYVPDIRIFPPQINDGYSFRVGGDADKLYEFGLWNGTLEQSWIASADVFIIEGWRFKDWKDILAPDRFRELGVSPVDTSCTQGSGVRVFERIR